MTTPQPAGGQELGRLGGTGPPGTMGLTAEALPLPPRPCYPALPRSAPAGVCLPSACAGEAQGGREPGWWTAGVCRVPFLNRVGSLLQRSQQPQASETPTLCFWGFLGALASVCPGGAGGLRCLRPFPWRRKRPMGEADPTGGPQGTQVWSWREVRISRGGTSGAVLGWSRVSPSEDMASLLPPSVHLGHPCPSHQPCAPSTLTMWRRA